MELRWPRPGPFVVDAGERYEELVQRETESRRVDHMLQGAALLYTSWRDKLVADYTTAVQSVVCAECGVASGEACVKSCGVVHDVRRRQAISEGYWDPTKVRLEG